MWLQAFRKKVVGVDMDLNKTTTADVVHSDLYKGYLIRIWGGDSTPLLVGVPYARKLLKDIAAAIKEIERREA